MQKIIKNDPGTNSTKKMLENRCQKNKTTQKMTPKSVPKDDFISGVVPLGAPWAPHPILEHKNCAQSVPKSALREQK